MRIASEALPQRARLRCLAVTLAAIVLALAAAASAQPSVPSAPGEALPAPAVVPVGQVGARAMALAERLDQIEAQRPTQALGQIEARLRELEVRATSAAERIESMLARSHGPGEVEAQAASLRRLGRSFDALEDRIDAEAEALGRTTSEIEEQIELWQRTLSSAREARAPELVLSQAQNVLDELARAGEQVGADLEAALELRQAAGEAERPLRGVSARIETAQRELATDLLVRQAEPVWRSIPASGAWLALPGAIRAAFSALLAELAPYAREHSGAMVVHGLAFLLLAWFLPRVRAQQDDRHPERRGSASDALRHPFSAALLVGCLLTPFLQPERVRVLPLLFVPIAIAALLRVLGGMLAPGLRGPLAGLAVLTLSDLVRASVLPGVPVASRSLLVIELGAALAGILWLRRPERLTQLPWRTAQSSWLRLLGGWVRLLPPALAGGLAAALLGYTDLAERVALVAIWGTTGGAAWVVLVRILEAVTEYLVDGRGLTRLRMIEASRTTLLRVVPRGLRALGLFTWLYLTLSLAGLLSPARATLGAVLSASIGYGSVSVSFGGVIAFFLTLWISWLIARFIAFALEQEVFTRVQTSPGVPFAVSTFTRYTILVLGFVVAMGALGFSLDRVTLLLSALGVGIGFGLQNVVNNFVSGAILLFERPVRVGDWVQLDELLGLVSSIGIRASKVRTPDGSDVIVPNGDLVSARVINWTLSDRRRRIILPVGVAYGSKPRQVIELLESVVRSQPGVLAEPAPVVLFRGFGESSLNFEIRAFTEGDWLAVLSELAVATSETLEAAHITIPFPQRDLHLRNPDALRDALREALRDSRADTRLPPELE